MNGSIDVVEILERFIGKFRPFLVTWGLFVLYYGGFQIWDTTMYYDSEVSFGYTFIAAIFSGVVLGLYGIPVSVFSDWITKNHRFRPLWAFLIHAGFGTIPLYLLLAPNAYSYDNPLGFALFGGQMATIFWLADEFFKWRDRRRGV